MHISRFPPPSNTAALPPSHTMERLAFIRLARTSGIGPMTFARLLGLYGTAERALAALPERARRAGRDIPEIPPQGLIEDEIAFLEKRKARHLLRVDPDYPLLLAHIPDAPPLLYVQGNVRRLSQSAVGIVGARNASTAGLRLAESLSAELAAAKICVVSGLARGIDTAAHQGALASGQTVAALASGIDQAYPPENARLQAAITEHGCLVTEAPPGTLPQARHFPRRNRLIAGISLGCVIIEAATRSGTLITARLAASYDRIVFAVPGNPLDARSQGGNQFLREGAVLVEHAQDILAALPEGLPTRHPSPWQRQREDLIPGLDRMALPRQTVDPIMATQTLPEVSSVKNSREKILSLLSLTPMAVDDVVTRCQLSVQAVMQILGELELEGMVESLPAGQVALLPGMARLYDTQNVESR